MATASSGGAFGAGSTCAPYSASKAAVNNLMYSYDEALRPYGSGATVLCPANINSNIGNAEKFRPANLKNTGYHVSEGTMAHLRSIHAQGIDPVELAEILKEGIENERVIVLPDRHPETWIAQMRRNDEVIESYTMTRADRDEWNRKRNEARRKEMEAMFADAGDEKEGGRRMPKGWEVPEGAEAFGHARHDLDWIDPTRK